jgi:hypothetical protein
VLEDLPEPAPGDGELLVEVEACGVGLMVLPVLLKGRFIRP